MICEKCDEVCDGCIGAGKNNCLKCKTDIGFIMKNGVCEKIKCPEDKVLIGDRCRIKDIWNASDKD